MAKLKGLGRGLDALLAQDTTDAGNTLKSMNVLQLRPGKYQPRSHMDQEALTQLADSIKVQGVMQPVLVRPAAGGYEIIAGERRWRAAQQAGLREIPVLVREIPDEAALAMALIENIQREDLNPLEEAAGIQRLISEFGMTHQHAAEAVGRSRSAVTNILRLLHLAKPVQEQLMRGHIDMGHARALLALNHGQQIDAVHDIVRNGLSVRETEKLVQRLLHPLPSRKVKVDRDILRLQEDIADKLGTRVMLKHGKKGDGKLVISYSSLEQLEGIISKF